MLHPHEQLSERQQLIEQVHNCLEGEVEPLPDDLVMVYKLTEYFLIFAAGFETDADASTLTIVDLTSVEMEAIQLLRRIWCAGLSGMKMSRV